MKRTFCTLILIFFIISPCAFTQAEVFQLAQAALMAEAERLANGVNLSNQSELRTFENNLRRSTAFRNYMTGVRSIWGELITEDIMIGQIIEGIRSTRELERMRIEAERILFNAETWSAGNVMTGAVLFDLSMQQRIKNDYEQNLVRAQANTEQYIGRIFQYTGQVLSVQRMNDYYGNFRDYYVFLTRKDGVYVAAYFDIDKTDTVLQLNIGNFITITGRCVRFLESNYPRGLSSVSLEECEVRYVAN